MKRSLAELLGSVQSGGSGKVVDSAAVADDPRYRIAREAHAIWRRCCSAGIPDRRQIDPVAFGPVLLPMLALIDVLGGGVDYRWRLFGTHHEQEYGASLTGMRLSDLEQQNPSAKPFRPILEHTVVSREPCYFELSYLNRGRVDRYATGVLLPLTDATPEIGVILGAADWWRPPRASGGEAAGSDPADGDRHEN